MNADPKHAGLGAAFAPARGGVPDRSAGLADMLNPKPHTDPPVAIARRAPKPARSPAPKHDPAGKIVVSVPIYLPPATLDKAAELCRARQTTYAALAVEAFTAIPRADLVAYFATAAVVRNPRGIPVSHPRARPGYGVQRQFRFLAETRDWIKAEVLVVGAPSVSGLVATVMGMHLETMKIV